jgi:hypothetical protein
VIRAYTDGEAGEGSSARIPPVTLIAHKSEYQMKKAHEGDEEKCISG